MTVPRKIRAIILWHHLVSFLAWLIVFAVFVALVSFDSEDQTLERQIQNETNKLMVVPESLNSSGTVQAMELNYYLGLEGVPKNISELIQPAWRNNFYEVSTADARHYHINVRETGNGQTLYVVFDATDYLSARSNLFLYLKVFAVFAFVLMAITAISARRMSMRISSPLESLSNKLSSLDNTSHNDEFEPTGVEELNALVQALQDRDTKIRLLTDREHQFNRDMSHELRTPLSVASGALEVMAKEGRRGAAFERLSSAVTDMTTLSEGVLWLVREPVREFTDAQVLADYCLQTYKDSAQSRGLSFHVSTGDATICPVPESVAKVILSNLVRNALHYTKEGEVHLGFEAKCVHVRDTGIGFGRANPQDEGFGIGLALTARLCQHYGLQFEVAEGATGGTQAIVSWN